MYTVKKNLALRKDLALGSTICALALTFALAWGSPFVGTSTAHAQDQAQPQQQQPVMPQQQQANPQNQQQSSTFSGTVVKNGDQFMLRDSSGETFRLDDPDRAQSFVGKAVKVTGQLDEQAKLIHVDSIVSAEG